MTISVYLASPGGRSGKSSIAVGLLDGLRRHVHRVGVFRPILPSRTVEGDLLLETALSQLGMPDHPARFVGVGFDDLRRDPDAAMVTILDRFSAVAAQYDAMLVLGTGFTDAGVTTDFALNARIAADLAAPILLVVPAAGHTPEQVRNVTEGAFLVAHENHSSVLGVVVNRVPRNAADDFREAVLDVAGEQPVFTVPESATLRAPTVRDLLTAAGGQLDFGSDELLDREALNVLAAAMTLPNLLDRLTAGCVVITPADRAEIVVGLLLAYQSQAFPPLAGLFLSGGLDMPPQVTRLVEGLALTLPVVAVDSDTAETAGLFRTVHGRITTRSERKIQSALMLVEEHVDLEALFDRLDLAPSNVVTPLRFQHALIVRARAADRHIVLPEGEEERVLLAADRLLRRRVVRLTLLGDPDVISARATSLRVNVGQARVVDPRDPGLVERFARRFAELRSSHGTTVDLARDLLDDRSYFGTMMVLEGLVDGMVSGSVTTTAQTIRPALQVIRTKPGVSIVSSVFLMLLADRVLVYGDCAINPDPSADQLADIAISSAETAEQFGIEPRVAMLSYSTGASGTGADVDKVRAATAIVRERAPHLSVEGPIQYDAAVDASVAATKLQGSPVAGRATVLIFPDLNTGNNTYKAVQRSAGAIAIGPVLQGLRKPVNDLSRGALVADIVNTVAITAIQAAAS